MNVITLIERLTRDPSYSEVQNEKGKHIISFLSIWQYQEIMARK